LNELAGDSSAVPEAEFERLTLDYAAFYEKTWRDAFKALDITLVVVRISDRAPYDAIPALREIATVGDFVVYDI